MLTTPTKPTVKRLTNPELLERYIKQSDIVRNCRHDSDEFMKQNQYLKTLEDMLRSRMMQG